jgi:hypothetical protein
MQETVIPVFTLDIKKISFPQFIISIAFILTLFGCGGGGGGSSSSDNTNVSSPTATSTQSSAPILSITSSYNTFGQSRDALQDGSYIYVADGTGGLVVLQEQQGNSITPVTTLSMAGSGRAYKAFML